MRYITVLVFAIAIGAALPAATIDPYYSSAYSVVSLGTPTGLTVPNFGGLTVRQGAPGTLLLGNSANHAGADIDTVPLIRDSSNRITGLGAGQLFANAYGQSGGGIDGGLFYGPGGVLLYTTSDNWLGQLEPGSTVPDKSIDLSALGYAFSTGGGQLIPTGFPGTGQVAITSFHAGRWYRGTLTPDGSGTFDLSAPLSDVLIGGGPEGIVYVPLGSPLFPNPSILVAEYGGSRVVSYELNAAGDPIVSSRRTFLSDLTGAEGATVDPLTNDILFSTYTGANEIIRVSRFDSVSQVPEPSTLALLGGGLLAFGYMGRRRLSK